MAACFVTAIFLSVALGGKSRARHVLLGCWSWARVHAVECVWHAVCGVGYTMVYRAGVEVNGGCTRAVAGLWRVARLLLLLLG